MVFPLSFLLEDQRICVHQTSFCHVEAPGFSAGDIFGLWRTLVSL